MKHGTPNIVDVGRTFKMSQSGLMNFCSGLWVGFLDRGVVFRGLLFLCVLTACIGSCSAFRCVDIVVGWRAIEKRTGK